MGQWDNNKLYLSELNSHDKYMTSVLTKFSSILYKIVIHFGNP